MDLEKIETIIKILNKSEVSEVYIKKDKNSLKIRKSKAVNEPEEAVAETATAAAPSLGESKKKAEEDDKSIRYVTSSLVGTFINADVKVGAGSKVKPGDIIGAIESMKLRTDIISEYEGIVLDVLVTDGMTVEYNQPLFKIKLANS
ncbi:MAG: acetyl-CoA carboxylase, biotin carboxyl carrier protein [Abditibacteriota bacterium]|nr:acetyl-CoA carboxylase, biotin carboxyl carrier protein [Abditibacteriota bacterium]